MVPNSFPTLSAPYRIAFVGEAPGKDEEMMGKPFVGASGRLFNALLSRVNIVRESCFIGNVCQHRPENNIITKFDWGGDEIQLGISQLFADLTTFKPNLIVCLGNTALHVIKEGNRSLKKRKTKDGWKFDYPNKVDDWRGSCFMSANSHTTLPITKCLAAYHPAYCLRNWDENVELLAFDLRKAAREGRTPDLNITKRRIVIADTVAATVLQVKNFIDNVRSNRLSISEDIEGYYHGMSCISISTTPIDSFVIPIFRKDGSSYWSLEDEIIITRELALLQADPNVPKVWQNGLYDRWVLQYGFGMPVFGNEDDTMLKWWEKYCELPKGLATQVSVLTDQPYYKGDRKSQDDDTFYRYCGMDSAVTKEIDNKLESMLTPLAHRHYDFNHALLCSFLYIELRGIAYNKSLAKERLDEVQNQINKLQSKLNIIAGTTIDRSLTAAELEEKLRAICCYKRDKYKVKKAYIENWDDILATIRKPTLTDSDYGFLETESALGLNIRSPLLKTYLYDPIEGLGLPPQYNKDKTLTTEALALMKLWKKHKHPALEVIIEIGFLRTRTTFLRIGNDPDGRIRCGYNVVGTVSGRISCYTSPTGSGYNLQTMPDKDLSKPESHPLRNGMRDLIEADIGHWMFQCDLKGSDGWTIGAHLNARGSSTMLDDLKAGIRPAYRICYMLRHGIQSLKGKTREEIKVLLEEIKSTDSDAFACKIGIWGICYLMGPDLLADQIFEESDGRIHLSRGEVADFHRAVFDGYQVKLWHDWMSRQLANKPELTSASGNTRRFFGRPKEILGEALSTEPQNNTTYATNLAAYRLWMDPDNRVDDKLVYDAKGGSKRVPFKIEPLHQVHDALLGQFAYEDTEWAVGKIREYFNNTLVIAGQEIIIPFEGKYGPSWGQLDKGKI